VILLLAYVGGMGEFVPSLFMTLAKWEGSHGVQVWAGSEGTRVVLTHPNAQGKKCHDAIHRHCLAARLLTSLAEPATNSGPDHIVQFAGGNKTGAEKRLLAPAPTSVVSELAAPADIDPVKIPIPRGLVDRSSWQPSKDQPPPAFLVELKVTLLLI
jgi:hypothetical protein